MEWLAVRLHIPENLAWALVGLIAVQLVAQGFALYDLVRRPAAEVRTGRKWVWILIIALGEIAGPIAYFAAGRLPRPTGGGTGGGWTGDGRRVADMLYGSESQSPPT